MTTASELLPSSASKFERDLSASIDTLPRVGPAAELIRNAKRENIPDSVVPWLIYEYGLGELLPYLPDPRTAIATGVLWQRLRGTPESFKIALGWIGNDGQIEESEANSIRWSQFQLGLAKAPDDLSQTDSIVEIGRLSSPVRSSLFRIYGGWYDGRRFTLDDHQLSSLDPLCDHTGVYLKTSWPQLSFGREFKDGQGDISGDLQGQLGVHRHNAKEGLYEDRTFLSNSLLGETPWRTLHIGDLSSCISRLHFSVYGPWWNNATDWDVSFGWDQVFDWQGLQNKFTPALKFAKAGMYLSDYAELGDTNSCLPARSFEEIGDGAVLLSEGNQDTGEGLLSEHISRFEYAEINERFEHETQLGSMWVSGQSSQLQIETHPLEHGVAFASSAHPNPPEHATLINTLSHYNGTRNNRSGLKYHVYGDGAGHQRGAGEPWTPLGLTSFADGDGSHDYPEYFDLDSLVIDEVAGTISAVDMRIISQLHGILGPGTTHTRPLFNADGVRRTTQFRFEGVSANGYNVGQIWIGFEIQLLPSHRHHTRELTYDDVFQLSKSRLSEHTPIPQTYSNTREHTTSAHQTATQSDQWQSAQQTWDSATWDGPDGWFEVDAQPVDTWASTYSWTNYPQLEQVLGFSLAGICLSETGQLSDALDAWRPLLDPAAPFMGSQTKTIADFPDRVGIIPSSVVVDETAGTISANRIVKSPYIFAADYWQPYGTITVPLFNSAGLRQTFSLGEIKTAVGPGVSVFTDVYVGDYATNLFYGVESNDGILGDTQATLSFTTSERFERGHQTTADHSLSDHELGLGDDWASVRGPGWVNPRDIGYAIETIQIDEVAGTISAQRVEQRVQAGATTYWYFALGTVDTFPLYDADGIRQRVKTGATTWVSFNYAADSLNIPNVWGGTFAHDLFIGNPLRLVPTHRERSATLKYLDRFILSLSRLSETIDLSQVTSNTREHTAESLQVQPQSNQWQLATETWDGLGAWDTEPGWFDTPAEDSTWATRYAWQQFPQLEHVLGFSRTMVTLSESGHLSDSDGVLGDTHATLGFFEEERVDRSHQTTVDHASSNHDLGLADNWVDVTGTLGWTSRDKGYAVETIQINELAGTITAQRVEQWTNVLSGLSLHYQLGAVDTFPLYDANGIQQQFKYTATAPVNFSWAAHNSGIANVWGGSIAIYLLIGNPLQLVPTHRERFQTLAYDDLFELSRSRLSEHIPLFNQQSNTREHGGELTWTTDQFNTWNDTSPTWTAAADWQSGGWIDAENEPTWYEAYTWQHYSLLEAVSKFSLAHLYLSDTEDKLGETNATLGWDVSQRFDRSNSVVTISGTHQILSAHRLHTRTVQSEATLFIEPTWADGIWAGPGAPIWARGNEDWQNGTWPAADWLDGADLTWADEPMWARIARWQVASLVVESQHQTHV